MPCATRRPWTCPGILCDALTARGIICAQSGRLEESLVLIEGTVSVAKRAGLMRAWMRGEMNTGDACLRLGLPESVGRSEAALAIARQLGDRGFESVAAGNLMLAHLLEGRWREVERMGREFLDGDTTGRHDIDYVRNRMATLHALRGEVDAARRVVAEMSEWRDSDVVEAHGLYEAVAAAGALAEGGSVEALERVSRATRAALEVEGPSSEAVRAAWPEAIETAVALERLDDAAALLGMLEGSKRGHMGPYLWAQLHRGRGLLASARGEHETAERELLAAIEDFAALSYPYWRARAQSDLAASLIDQGRAEEAEPLLEEAIATFDELGAAPALERARRLQAARSPSIPR